MRSWFRRRRPAATVDVRRIVQVLTEHEQLPDDSCRCRWGVRSPADPAIGDAPLWHAEHVARHLLPVIAAASDELRRQAERAVTLSYRAEEERDAALEQRDALAARLAAPRPAPRTGSFAADGPGPRHFTDQEGP